jgi:hypothetical protein
VLNLTVTGGSRAGYALVYAPGSAKPLVSNINYAVGQTLDNLAVARLDAFGRVAISVSGSTQVLANVVCQALRTSTSLCLLSSRDACDRSRSVPATCGQMRV